MQESLVTKRLGGNFFHSIDLNRWKIISRISLWEGFEGCIVGIENTSVRPAGVFAPNAQLYMKFPVLASARHLTNDEFWISRLVVSNFFDSLVSLLANREILFA